MIEFKKIRFKNILSYSNTFTEYEFTKGLTLIQGKNGSGKSTIIDALYFVLFGVAYRKINIGLLINTINKNDLLVELELNYLENEYKLIKCFKKYCFQENCEIQLYFINYSLLT
jgi:DNA repair exonuclease SbcCD ATPase subunit